MWTLTELAALAAQALADARVHAANGRVTGMPDGRLIRWYTTIGLLDRPVIGSGRVARYGPRHLLQVVAIKRLQAEGLPLAAIQQRLMGATDEQLREIAAVSPSILDAAPGGAADGAAAAPNSRRPGRFWRDRPVDAGASDGQAAGPGGAATASGGQRQDRLDNEGDTVTRLYGLRLSGLTLLLTAEPAARDLDAIASAARPLLDLLAARGLIRPDTDHCIPNDSRPETENAGPTEGTRS